MSPKVLLVDDNADLLKITQIILNGQGYQTVLAYSGQEAQAQIKLFQPHVILLDICLCDEDGQDLCRRLKSDAATNTTRIILMSGHDKPVDIGTAADDFLAKPFDFTELITKVGKQIEQIPVSSA